MEQSKKDQLMTAHQANELLGVSDVASFGNNLDDLRGDQPTSQLSEHAITTANNALQEGQTHYVDVPGIMPLREAIADALPSGYNPEGVLVTAGVQEARFLALQVLAEESSVLAVPSIVHPGVRKALGIRSTKHTWIKVEDDLRRIPTIEAIESALVEGANRIFLESPGRLTGAVYDSNEVDQISDLADKHGALVMIDTGLSGWLQDPNIYNDLNSVGRITFLGEAFPGVGLEGLSIGYIATNEEHLPGITAMKQIISICTSTATQYAALGASDGYGVRRSEAAASLSQNKESMLEWLNSFGAEILVGYTANLVAVSRTDAIVSALRDRGLTPLDGAGFGAPDVLRLSITEGVK